MNALIILVGGLLVFMLVGVPVVYSLGLVSMLYMLLDGSIAFNVAVVAQGMLNGINNFTLLAVPFFIFAANVMNKGGITDRIFRFTNTVVGHMPGGLGQVNIFASIIFAGMSGSASADAAGLGSIEIKAMRDAGYDEDFSVAVTGASSIIGPIIPPSIPLVLYAVSSETSVGALLLAGILPGLLLGGLMMVYVAIYAKIKKFPRERRYSIKEIIESFIRAFFPLLTPIILIMGIFSGWFTATEAAVVAALYAMLVAFLYGDITIRDIPGVIHETMKLTVSAVILVTTANLYGWLVLRAGIPQYASEAISLITVNPQMTLFVIIGFLLVMGMIMDPIPGILILTPILAPHVVSLGVSPIHFGIIMILTLMIGLITPPVGMVLYILQKVSKIPFERIVKAILPFFIPILFTLFILALFPDITLAIPNLFFNRY
jgi:tripartite ATP-independent transporter DctM subunit